MENKKLEIEKISYWKTSKSSPDTWLDRTVKLIEDYGGTLLNQVQGTDHTTGNAAFMIIFKLEGSTFKVIFPVLKPKNQSDMKAAKIQAATILYHDIKARLVSSIILGARNVFFGNLLLDDGMTAAELENPRLSIKKIFSLASGEVVDGEFEE